MPREDTQFKPGHKSGGRPKGAVSGRKKIIGLLDSILAEEGTQKRFDKAIKDEIEKDPMAFLHKYVYPVLPKDAVLTFNGKEITGIKIEFTNGSSC